MQDPDPKCRHFGILWQFMAFLPKSRIGNQIRFFQFYPIFPLFRLFPTFRFHNSSPYTACSACSHTVCKQ